MQLDANAVLALAPDASAAKAGQAQANLRHWRETGCDDLALWGLCQGSGKDPYQVRVALADYASACTCPSRKFPCKHALGLMLLAAQKALTPTAAPEYVAEWLAKRAQRAEKQAAAPKLRSEAETAKAEQAAERRAEQRQERRSEGLAELARWLQDLMRAGLGNVPLREGDFFESRARRLVDAQLPGLARRIRLCADLVGHNGDWPQAVLREFGRLHLAIAAHARRDALSPLQQCDLDRFLGGSQSADADAADAGYSGPALCLGSVVEELDALIAQRCWWWLSEAQQLALVLRYTPSSQPLQLIGAPGQSAQLELRFLPSAWPLRAQLQTLRASTESVPPVASTIESALAQYAGALAADPWNESLPLVIHGRLHLRDEQLWLCDAQDQALPLGKIRRDGWRWLAESAGADAIYSGEWDGERFRLLHGWLP